MWTSPYYTSVVDTTLCGHYNTICLGGHCNVLIILYFRTLPGWTLKVWSLLGNTTVWTLLYADNTLLYNSVDTSLYEHYTVKTLLGNRIVWTLYYTDTTYDTIVWTHHYGHYETTLHCADTIGQYTCVTAVWKLYYVDTTILYYCVDTTLQYICVKKTILYKCVDTTLCVHYTVCTLHSLGSKLLVYFHSILYQCVDTTVCGHYNSIQLCVDNHWSRRKWPLSSAQPWRDDDTKKTRLPGSLDQGSEHHTEASPIQNDWKQLKLFILLAST